MLAKNLIHSQIADLVQELKSEGLPSFSTLFMKLNWKWIYLTSLKNDPKVSFGSRIIGIIPIFPT